MALIMFILVALLILAIFLGISSLLLYLFYRWLVKKGYKWVGVVLVLSSIAFLSFNIYTAIYPLDGFYFDDFKKITSKEIPSSASIIKKTASYPDFHGKYVSCSLMQLSRQDYRNLLTELGTNKDFIKNPDRIYSEEFDEVLKNKNIKNIKSAFARNIDGHSDQRSYIGFFNDGETIVVWFFQ